MDTLSKQVARARRRLWFQSLAGKLAWCWFTTLLVAVVAIGVHKYWPLADELTWAAAWAGGALGIGLIAGFVWTWLGRHDAIAAAVEIDRRFGLKERVSSTLALDSTTRESDIGRALIRDAEQRVGRIDVAEHFHLRLDRRALLPLAPAAAACAVLFLISSRTPDKPAQAATAAEAVQIKKSTQALAKKLEEQQKKAAEKGLSEADLAVIKQLEESARNLADKKATDPKRALQALNDSTKNLEKRRNELASSAELKQQLSNLKNLQQGPAEKLGQALKTGDLKKAISELDKLKDQLAGDKLDAPAKEALAKQLEQLQQSLEKKLEAQKQAQNELKEEIEKQRQAGNTAAADKLQQQLDKLAQQGPQMEKLAQMSQQLKQAAESMKQGDSKQASESLSQLSDQLASMQQEMEQLETLNDALDQVTDAKNSMACKECEGEGCEACQGGGKGMKMSERWSRQDGARGEGRGAGDRDEQKNATNFYDSQVKQNVGKGASVVTGTADGPNRKGLVREEIRGQFSSAEQQTEEALSGQRLPKEHRNHAKDYFDSLRQGQR